jgi:hypothetical protein
MKQSSLPLPNLPNSPLASHKNLAGHMFLQILVLTQIAKILASTWICKICARVAIPYLFLVQLTLMMHQHLGCRIRTRNKSTKRVILSLDSKIRIRESASLDL